MRITRERRVPGNARTHTQRGRERGRERMREGENEREVGWGRKGGG